jgi:hypothetical protein
VPSAGVNKDGCKYIPVFWTLLIARNKLRLILHAFKEQTQGGSGRYKKGRFLLHKRNQVFPYRPVLNWKVLLKKWQGFLWCWLMGV